MGLFDFLKPDDRQGRLLLDGIAYNADVIQKTENKSRDDAEYLAICVLIDDLAKRERGQIWHRKLMELLPSAYPQHLNDVITYIAWSRGMIELLPEAEAALKARHAR